MKHYGEIEVVETIAKIIMTNARTAPKSRGIDTLEIGLVEEDEKRLILDEMRDLYTKTQREIFSRDAKNLEDAHACILFGIKNDAIGLDCGACGYDCEGLRRHQLAKSDHYNGPVCAFKAMDLGIALGSACKTASQMGVDNRLMYSVGLAAKRAGIIEGDIVIALPLSVTGKNIFFDRAKQAR